MTDQGECGITPRVLREYALLADGERGALVGPDGEMAWLCLPRWDSDAVFATLLGGPGAYLVTPDDRWKVWGGYYEPGTLIWRSRWVTGTGIAECHEALAFPGDAHRAVLLRRVVAVQGPVRVRARLELRPGFGRDRADRPHRYAGPDGSGGWCGRAGPLHFRWSGADTAEADPRGGLALTRELPAGGRHDFVLEVSDRPLAAPPVRADGAWESTRRAWRRAVPPCQDTLAPRDARHAYAVLRGLTSAGGAMVAAATMSLPERADTDRNFDYRYAWIRDQCYAGVAVGAHRPDHPLFDGAVRFVTERLLDDGPGLKPAYTCDGGPVPGERSLALPGYPGGAARSGNRVNHQFQLDVLGEILILLSTAARHRRLDDTGRRAAAVAVDAIAARWTEPDAGVWELGPRHWTHSRLSCVAGLRSAVAADLTVRSGRTGDAGTLADRILADTTTHCRHPSGRWQRSRTDSGVDSALLLPPVRGAVPADDPRTLATLRAVYDELTEDGYVYRYRSGGPALGQDEGAFLLSGFVTALAAWQQSDQVAAARWFERNRAACGPPGLFTEEYDVAQRQLRGNLPQAFVHALLLECAARLTHPPPAGASRGQTSSRASR